MNITIGVLALQGAFYEHIQLLKQACLRITPSGQDHWISWKFVEVRTNAELAACDALIIPGGESTTISLVAARSGLLDGLREFVKVLRKPTWGTCAGLILLAESANRTKKGGQDLIGGLDVRVNRNHFGRQVESFQEPINLPFLERESAGKHPVLFPGIFIRAPIVEKILPNLEGIQVEEEKREDTVVAPTRPVADKIAEASLGAQVDILTSLPGRTARLSLQDAGIDGETGDIIAVRQGNVFGTSFHPELTTDSRIHEWWLRQVEEAVMKRRRNDMSAIQLDSA